MRSLRPRPIAILLPLLAFLSPASAVTSPNNTGDLPQGYLFGFTTSSLPLPIVNSCPSSLTVSTATALSYGGNDPSSPYYMMFMVREQLLDDNNNLYERYYTHTETLPDMNNVRSLFNPFMNGTQFIACVTSANGVSGGCQDLITVVPSVDLTIAAYANETSQCRTPAVREHWVTPANQTLAVDLISNTGASSLVGWPATCSDLMFVPKNGTPPYTTVIAPAQHPPVNISSVGSGASDNSMNYTIRLTHGQSFMAAVFDSAGNSWAAGPLHAGTSSDLSCLAVATGANASSGSSGSKSGGIAVGALAGGVVGAFIVGALVAFLVFMLVDKRRKRRAGAGHSRDTLDLYADPRMSDKANPPVTPFSETAPSVHHQLGYAQPLLNTNVPQGEGSLPSPGSGGGYHGQGTSPDTATDIISPMTPGFGSICSPSAGAGPSSHYCGASGSLHGRSLDRSQTIMSANSYLSPGASANPNEGTMNSLHTTCSRHSEAVPNSASSTFNSETSSAAAAALAARNVYVVHSDSGAGGDYHIQLPAGMANVIELPPGYSPSGEPSSAPAGGSGTRRRRPESIDRVGAGGTGSRSATLRARNGSFDGDRQRVIGESGQGANALSDGEDSPRTEQRDTVEGGERVGDGQGQGQVPTERERERDTRAQSEKARLIASMGRPL